MKNKQQGKKGQAGVIEKTGTSLKGMGCVFLLGKKEPGS
jgi:hypothetical protein